MSVSEIMTMEPCYCVPDATLQEIAAMMVAEDCVQIPVCEYGTMKPIEVVTEVDLFELLGEAFSVVLTAPGSQLALNRVHVEILVDAVNLAILNMKGETAEEVILLPGGFELDRRKVCLVGQHASGAVFKTGKLFACKQVHKCLDPAR